MSDRTTTQSDKDLEASVIENRKHLREVRFNIAGSKVKNVREQRNIKRSIASALTELRKRSGK